MPVFILLLEEISIQVYGFVTEILGTAKECALLAYRMVIQLRVSHAPSLNEVTSHACFDHVTNTIYTISVSVWNNNLIHPLAGHLMK